IATLGRYGTLTSGSLTERTSMDKAKVSRAVSRLTAAQLIARRDNENDMRSNLLCLTEQGQQVHDRIVPIALGLEQELTSVLS
ncbi:MarR family transcriptional regulator, partial [Staphylococcus nepalensis]|nr:MarR family transcriptional regulator [Staphylococcus nepalensis]